MLDTAVEISKKLRMEYHFISLKKRINLTYFNTQFPNSSCNGF